MKSLQDVLSDDDAIVGLKAKLAAKRAELDAKQHVSVPPSTACPKCHGAEWVLTARWDFEQEEPPEMVPCPACNETRVAEQRFERLVGASGLEEFAESTFSGNKPYRGQEGPWEQCLDWSNNPIGWLWMSGESYRGKSFLAQCIGNFWLSNGKAVLYRNVPKLFDELREGYAQASETGFNERFEAVMTAPLLILDDFGQQKDTIWLKEKLFVLSDYRLERRMPTVVTTNLTLDDVGIFHFRLGKRINDDAKTTLVPFSLIPEFQKELLHD